MIIIIKPVHNGDDDMLTISKEALAIQMRYRNDDDPLGYDAALGMLVGLGYTEKQADDILHPMKAPPSIADSW